MEARRCACRFACCTCAIAATLWAPALVQAVLVLRPDLLAARHETLAVALTLAASLTALPALFKSLVSNGVPPRRNAGG